MLTFRERKIRGAHVGLCDLKAMAMVSARTTLIDLKRYRVNNPKQNRGRHRNNARRSNPSRQNFDSNGPGVRIRGNATQVYEKYIQLARDAQGTGDRVMAENLLQHAEHYYRILNDGAPDRNQHRPQNQDSYMDQGAEQTDQQDQPEVGEVEDDLAAGVAATLANGDDAAEDQGEQSGPSRGRGRGRRSSPANAGAEGNTGGRGRGRPRRSAAKSDEAANEGGEETSSAVTVADNSQQELSLTGE